MFTLPSLHKSHRPSTAATEGATTPRRSRRSRQLLFAVVPALAVASSVVCAGNASADVDGIGTGAVADYSCSQHTVFISPWTLEPPDGNFNVLARGEVYDYATGQWLTGDWYTVDGITALTFSVSQPAAQAVVTFAHDSGGGNWTYDQETVDITNDLDNGFCAITPQV